MNKLVKNIGDRSTFFQENGYVLIKNAIPNVTLAQKEISKIVKEARLGKIPSAVVFYDYPEFIAGINVGQINFPFEDCNPLPATKSAIEAIDFEKIFENYINADYNKYLTYELRIHVTSKFFKYMQPWHRDLDSDVSLTIQQPKQPSSLRMNLYFFDEEGFQIISKRHEEFYRDRIKEREIFEEGRLHCKSDLDIADVVKAEAGDILIFHPDTLHRGCCSMDRASFHLVLHEDNDIKKIVYEDYLPNNIQYFRSKSLPSSMAPSKSLFRKTLSLIKYYSPLPSTNFYKFLFKKPAYVKNNFIQRGSIFQK
ncbi:MAG: hypothetical protein KGO80_03490 [Bacteroidetes bacterium]|nr:hypothetical protein [Bacteroidota bacterium]